MISAQQARSLRYAIQEHYFRQGKASQNASIVNGKRAREVILQLYPFLIGEKLLQCSLMLQMHRYKSSLKKPPAQNDRKIHEFRTMITELKRL